MLLADHSETGPKGLTSWKPATKAILNLDFKYLRRRITSLSRKLLLVEENPGNDLNGRLPTTRHTTTWSYVYYVIEDPAVREQLMSFFGNILMETHGMYYTNLSYGANNLWDNSKPECIPSMNVNAIE